MVVLVAIRVVVLRNVRLPVQRTSCRTKVQKYDSSLVSQGGGKGI